MLTIKDVLNYCASQMSDVKTWRANKADYTKDKSITIYNSSSPGGYRYVYGGLNGYETKSISILVHWGTNPTEAEETAQRLYDLLCYADFTTDDYTCKSIPVYNGPAYIGLSDDGMFEYVINVEIYYKRKN